MKKTDRQLTRRTMRRRKEEDEGYAFRFLSAIIQSEEAEQ